MSSRIKHAVMFAMAAVAALAATGAAAETVVAYSDASEPYYYDAVTGEYHYGPPPATDSYVVENSMPYYVVHPDDYYVGGTDDVYYVEPAITVYGPRDEDVAINNDVVDAIASDPRVNGRIGVTTFRRQVRLDGRVGTNEQRNIAETDAYNVDGVDRVENQLHAAVGEW